MPATKFNLLKLADLWTVVIPGVDYHFKVKWLYIVENWLYSVCFITKSVLTYSFFSPTATLSSISRPLSSSMCSITPETANVGSSYDRMRGPGSDCQWGLTLKFTLTSENLSLYTTLLLYWSLYNYLDSNYCRTITAEVCTVAAVIASASVGDVPVGYSTFHVDLAS